MIFVVIFLKSRLKIEFMGSRKPEIGILSQEL